LDQTRDDPPIVPADTAPIRIEPTIMRAPVAPMALPALPGKPTPSDAIPALKGEDIAVPLGRLLPEGAFLSQREGALVRARTGEWIFVSTPTPTIPPTLSTAPTGPSAGVSTVLPAPRISVPPMVLLPSQTLQNLERAIAQDAPGIRITLSGQVFVYHARNYLLCTLFTVRKEHPSAQTQVDEASARSSEDPRVAALLGQLEAEGQVTSNLDRPTPTPTSKGSSGDALLREGRLRVREAGRIVRVVSGRLAFAIDQDGSDIDPAILLPSATLTRIEAAVARAGEAQRVIISGREYVYADTRYMLPISFTLAPAQSELQPIQ